MNTIAIANQKGGVGKTSTAISLGAALVRAGVSVLLVDLDPQASLTEYFTNPKALTTTIHHLIVEGKLLTPIRLGEKISLLPANRYLTAAEIMLPTITNHERALARRLKTYEYDFCLIDCPSSVGVLTRNALTAANRVLIPCATETLALRTLPETIETIEDIKESELNPMLTIWRILPTMFSAREIEDNRNLEELKGTYNSLVYPEPVNRRTNYKKAVRDRMDVNDLDAELGEYWNRVAATLIAESGVSV